MARHRIVVGSARRPWLRLAAVVALVVVVMLGAFGLYRYLAPVDPPAVAEGSDGELRYLRSERRRLIRELRTAQKDVEDLRGQSTFDTRSCEIDAQACAEVQRSVSGLETQVADLREQLALYKSIVSPEQALAGVRVLSISVRPAGPDNVWRYDLVLVQPMRRDRVAVGSYDFSVEGLLDKQLKTLKLEELMAGDPEPPAFNFRSFEEFSGELRFPAGFLPSRLTVTLSVQDSRAESRKAAESFDWSRLISAG
ncbi:MAG: DUF6776 family protein [Panacagrimonas sp.]